MQGAVSLFFASEVLLGDLFEEFLDAFAGEGGCLVVEAVAAFLCLEFALGLGDPAFLLEVLFVADEACLRVGVQRSMPSVLTFSSSSPSQ